MPWYYEVDRQQRGPVSDQEFAGLVQAGTIRAETLVWQEGWENWRTWGSVAGMHSAGVPASYPGLNPTGSFGAGTSQGPMPFEFSGSGGEYFRIWIVNILLTVATLGIYAAWAKVRTRRYFYANTSLAGHCFEYLAEPKRILIGNLIVGGTFLLFSVAAAISPILQVAFMLLLAVAVPGLLAASLRFNARYSAWRGLRFNFKGRYGGALWVFVILPMLTPFTLGLLWPYVAKCRKDWLVENHAYGTTPFRLGWQTGDVYMVYLKSLLFFVPLVVGYFVMVGTMVAATMRGGDPTAAGAATGALMLMPLLMLAGFFSAFVGATFVRARLFNLAWNQTSIGTHRFEASLRARDLIGLQLTNMLLTLVTLGLAWPWVAVRTARFQLSRLTLITDGDLDSFVADSQPAPGSVGEAAGDFLDFDVGFGV